MWNSSSLRVELPTHELSLNQQGAHIGFSWHEGRPLKAAAKRWSVERDPRGSGREKQWFPLPSYYLNDSQPGAPWHHLGFPHWFVILCYLGVWQLPWLWRYHREQRIRRSLGEMA